MIARNQNRRRAAQVRLEEITQHAKPTCRICSGTGIVRHRPVGRDIKPEDVVERGCSCAAARFVKAHPEVIVSEEGYAWWPAPDAEQPESKAAPPLAALDEPEPEEPGPDPRAGRLDRIAQRRAAAAAELADLEAEMARATEPFRAKQRVLADRLAGLEQVAENLRSQKEALAAELGSIAAETSRLAARRTFLEGPESARLDEQEATLRRAIQGAENEVSRVAGEANEAAHKLRRLVIPLRHRVEQLDRRAARVRAYLPQGNPEAPSNT